jgi:hypothetical protein
LSGQCHAPHAHHINHRTHAKGQQGEVVVVLAAGRWPSRRRGLAKAVERHLDPVHRHVGHGVGVQQLQLVVPHRGKRCHHTHHHHTRTRARTRTRAPAAEAVSGTTATLPRETSSPTPLGHPYACASIAGGGWVGVGRGWRMPPCPPGYAPLVEITTVVAAAEVLYTAVVHAYASSVRYAVLVPSSSYTRAVPEEAPGTICTRTGGREAAREGTTSQPTRPPAYMQHPAPVRPLHRPTHSSRHAPHPTFAFPCPRLLLLPPFSSCHPPATCIAPFSSCHPPATCIAPTLPPTRNVHCTHPATHPQRALHPP